MHPHYSRAGLTLALALILIGGCGPGRPCGARLRRDVARPRPGVIIFLVDGLPAQQVARGCDEGWLPNIRERLWDGGARVRHATTCLPGITYAAIASLLTGTQPDRHTIVANRWFEPEAMLFRDYTTIAFYRAVNADFEAPTLYELIAPAPSVSIQAAHQRGVTHNLANWAVSGVMWCFKNYTAVDKLTASTLADVVAWTNRQGRWPSVVTFYFPGPDSVGHDRGPESPEFRSALVHVDHQIGRVCAWLAGAGLLDSSYLFLVSDHGLVPVAPEHVVDLGAVLRSRGRSVTQTMPRNQDGRPLPHRRASYNRFDTVLCHQNGRAAFLYFRGRGGWGTPPDASEVAQALEAPPAATQLWNLPGVDLVAYLVDDREAIVRNPRGAARVRQCDTADGPAYAYVPESGDPLGYLDAPALAAFVTAGYHDERAWLTATAGHPRPDVPPAILPLLRAGRAGQVVVFAAPGYSFIAERGGHGGLAEQERDMTFLVAGPGIRPGSEVPTARSVDLVPTILELLGTTPREHAWLDGKSLATELWGASGGPAE